MKTILLAGALALAAAGQEGNARRLPAQNHERVRRARRRHAARRQNLPGMCSTR